ncbi:MAG: hypothetical protein LBV23_07085, partial [Deltaproteobacteria bacterium]|nr:hypothetical protein [Deltaproteobacteria bacterium]
MKGFCLIARLLARPSAIRSRALIVKETRQMLRDKSTLTLGVVLPIILLLIFGFGLSLDVSNVAVGFVRDNSWPQGRELFFKLDSSDYFDVKMENSYQAALDDFIEENISIIIRAKRSLANEG